MHVRNVHDTLPVNISWTITSSDFQVHKCMSFDIYVAFSSWIEDRISEMFVLIDVAICQVVCACELAGQHQQTHSVISRQARYLVLTYI